MTIRVEDCDGVKVLHVQGELTGGDGKSELVDSVTDLLSGPNARIVLDLSEVSYMNSAGLGDVVRLVAQANVQEARVVLANLSAYMTGVVEMTKLNQFFEIYPSSEDALKVLG